LARHKNSFTGQIREIHRFRQLLFCTQLGLILHTHLDFFIKLLWHEMTYPDVPLSLLLTHTFSRKLGKH